MIVYADTSFVFSLFVQDSNSPTAIARVKKLRQPLLMSDFGEFEFVNALALRIYRKELSAGQQYAALDLFSKDVQTGMLRIVPVPSAALSLSRKLAQAHTPTIGARALDILHVATALAFKAKMFCTFDEKQSSLARAAKLSLV